MRCKICGKDFGNDYTKYNLHLADKHGKNGDKKLYELIISSIRDDEE